MAEATKTKKKKGIIRRFFKWLFLILISLLLILTVWNHICGLGEKKQIRQDAYGQVVQVNGKNMVAEIRGAEHDTTIVLLPGLGAISPVLEFKPLAEELSGQYRVITVEPFGYGLSDLAGTDRTLNAVVNELNSCVKSLGCTEYYLMGHSIAGIYAIAWANQYPDEVLGFIGIDNSVPKQTEYNPYPIDMLKLNKIVSNVSRVADFIGIPRLMSVSDPKACLTADASYPYTDEEIKLFRLMTLHRNLNSDVRNEIDCLTNSFAAARQMTLPDTVPALIFVSDQNCEIIPEWEQLHRDIVTETERSEVRVLHGAHYLHLDNKQNIVDAVFAWIPESE